MTKNITRIISITLLITLLTTSGAGASAHIPGSTGDPLVSQSFVEERLDRLNDEFQARLDAFQGQGTFALDDRQMDIIVEEVIRVLAEGSEQIVFTPVHMLPGQRLIGEEGTELILRSGIAMAVAPGANGLSDVTQAADIMNNVQVSQNHLLIIPRTDGRGIRAQTEVWVMVKGAFTLSF